MEHQKILNLVNKASDDRFGTRKKNIINDQSSATYTAENKIICRTEVFNSNLWNYNDAYILLTCYITIIGDSRTRVAFKNRAPISKCIKRSW